MCFSIFQASGCRIHNLASICWKGFHGLNKTNGSNSRSKLLCSKTYGAEGGYSKRWIRRPVTTKRDGRSETAWREKANNIRQEILEGTVLTSAVTNVNRTEISEVQNVQCCDTQQKIAENKDIAKIVTVIVFDIETTGFSRENERIIEIALQDIAGGANSTFQALINPGRYVPNAHVHGITTQMVNRPDVPRMEELIPILLQYVKSRQKPGGYILWVAHNARSFDVPFLINEFTRCSTEIPLNWLFLDTLPLARELMKLGGLKGSKTSLQALREHYCIPLVGSAHRAMSDVYSLSLILQRLTYELKLPISGLVERSFTASDTINLKKKKNSS